MKTSPEKMVRLKIDRKVFLRLYQIVEAYYHLSEEHRLFAEALHQASHHNINFETAMQILNIAPEEGPHES
jgi:hypothetical protein